MSWRQSVVTGVESVGKNAPEIEIDEPGLRIEKKLPVRQHLFERRSPRLQLHAQTVLLFAPLLKAVTTEFSLLVAAISELLRLWDELLKVRVVQFERERLDIIVNVAPENVLNAVQ